jgi:hypothetical protein
MHGSEFGAASVYSIAIAASLPLPNLSLGAPDPTRYLALFQCSVSVSVFF